MGCICDGRWVRANCRTGFDVRELTERASVLGRIEVGFWQAHHMKPSQLAMLNIGDRACL